MTEDFKNELRQKAKKLFANNANLVKLFMTADRTAFVEKGNALLHARSLQDNGVLEVVKNGATELSTDLETSAEENRGSITDENTKGARINPLELTDKDLSQGLTDEFTMKEKAAIAVEFNMEVDAFKGLRDAEQSSKLVELATESQRELLIQRLEAKKEDFQSKTNKED